MKIKTNELVCLLDRQDVFVFNVVCSFWWRCPNIKCTYFIFFFFSNNSLAQSQMFLILFLIIIISWQSAAKKIKCGNVLKCVVISNYNVFCAEYSTQWIKLAELIVMLEKSCLIVKIKPATWISRLSHVMIFLTYYVFCSQQNCSSSLRAQCSFKLL